MYLKVPYVKVGNLVHDASVKEVKAALPADMPGLTVDDNLGYPSVNFPDGSKYPDLQRVQKVLQERGFETE